MKNKSRAFTLIELLVVVLIIGILAAVAIPQYEKAVEKARMAEAIIVMRAIRDAHMRYYLANGTYLSSVDIDKLDVEIPGAVSASGRKLTTHFEYAPNGCGSSCTDPAQSSGYLALATRRSAAPEGIYNIQILQNSPQAIHCGQISEKASSIQRSLCQELNAKGTL